MRTRVLLTRTRAAVSPLDSGQRAESRVGAETVCVRHPQPHLFFPALHRLRRGHVQRSQLPGPGHLSRPAAADRCVHQDRDCGRPLSFSVFVSGLDGLVFFWPGYRSVPLKNSYSEDLELASLLVHVEIVNAKVSAGGTGSRPVIRNIKYGMIKD